MKAFLRLWAMCLWLMVTSPLWWASAAAVLIGRWRYPVAGWLWFVAFIFAGVVALAASMFVEVEGGLNERIRLAGAERDFLLAALLAISALSAILYAAVEAIW
ncbi:MAG: hypothetical protein ACUVTY_01765 [Armatimonadota bacterium]